VSEVLIHGYYTVKDRGVHIFSELVQLQLESIHSKMLSHAAKSSKRSGLRSWYSLLGFIQCVHLFYVSLNSFTSERPFECLSSKCPLSQGLKFAIITTSHWLLRLVITSTKWSYKFTKPIMVYQRSKASSYCRL